MDIDRAAVRAEINSLRERIMKLHDSIGQGCAPLLKDPPRISVGMTREEFSEIQELARRCNTSVSSLGQLAIKHLLLQCRDGALPLLPPWKWENTGA